MTSQVCDWAKQLTNPHFHCIGPSIIIERMVADRCHPRPQQHKESIQYRPPNLGRCWCWGGQELYKISQHNGAKNSTAPGQHQETSMPLDKGIEDCSPILGIIGVLFLFQLPIVTELRLVLCGGVQNRGQIVFVEWWWWR